MESGFLVVTEEDPSRPKSLTNFDGKDRPRSILNLSSTDHYSFCFAMITSRGSLGGFLVFTSEEIKK